MSNAGTSFSESALLGLSDAKLSCKTDDLPHENASAEHDIIKIVVDPELKRKLLAEIGQDLHEPLNAIIGFSEVLQGAAGQALQSEKRDEYISLIHKAALLLKNTLGNKLTQSGFEETRTTLVLQEINVEEVLQDAFQTLKITADDRSVELCVQFSENLPYIHADKQKLQHLMITLIGDAIEASQAGDRIFISVRKFASKVTISIQGRQLVTEVNRGNETQLLPRGIESIVEAHSGNISCAAVSTSLHQIVVKLPIGLKMGTQKPFNPANDTINLNENKQAHLKFPISIEESILVRKTG